MEGTEGLVHNLAGWLRLVVETTGALIVGIGFVAAAIRFVRESLRGNDSDFTSF